MAASHVAIVRKTLKEYADRGVFGSFTEKDLRNAKTQFEFLWLHNRRYTLIFDGKNDALTFKDCFPNVPARSELDGGIKDFLKERSNPKLRPHRRIDPKRAVVACTNRSGKVSLRIKVQRNQYAYATKKLVTLLHETFLMIDQCFTEYLYEHFDLPEE